MGVVVAFTLVNVYTTFKKPRKAETTLVQKEITTVRTPYIRILPQAESTVTIPLKKKTKLELNATIEEFKYYFMTNKFTNETTKGIVIIGEKVADDSKDIKWTIY
jgi:hypothetical protein